MALQIVTSYFMIINLEKIVVVPHMQMWKDRTQTTEASRAINNDYPHTDLWNAISSVMVQG